MKQSTKENRPARWEKTRARIMAHGERVFRERGFRKVTVEELCADMGMSKRTFYRHFPDRDSLVLAVLAETASGHMTSIVENLTSDRPVDQVFRNHFDLLIHNVFARLSTHLMADIQIHMPEVWARIDQFRTGVVGIITDLLRRGQREGSIRRDVDPNVAGKLVQGVMTHLANPQFLLDQGLSFDQFASTFERLLLHGVLTQRNGE